MILPSKDDVTVNQGKRFSEHIGHINGIENFWNQAKRHLRCFNGVPKQHFHRFLRECEWRFNTPNPKQQLTQLQQWIIWYSPKNKG